MNSKSFVTDLRLLFVRPEGCLQLSPCDGQSCCSALHFPLPCVFETFTLYETAIKIKRSFYCGSVLGCAHTWPGAKKPGKPVFPGDVAEKVGVEPTHRSPGLMHFECILLDHLSTSP